MNIGKAAHKENNKLFDILSRVESQLKLVLVPSKLYVEKVSVRNIIGLKVLSQNENTDL
ncbi:hypothetical protein SK128_022861 [Halocaridina rubra]|uniref:Uncharacterized protein n=1 Tax=Halocaridina rubra TaxID=373956 RepID=A0AAN8WW09_HALRR